MMPMPDPHNLDPARIHGADEMYAQARNHLDKIIAYVRQQESNIYAMAGNTDTSVLYDWFRAYIKQAENHGGQAMQKHARDTTLLMCAAALTRLVRDTRTDATLAQLDWKEPDDDH